MKLQRINKMECKCFRFYSKGYRVNDQKEESVISENEEHQDSHSVSSEIEEGVCSNFSLIIFRIFKTQKLIKLNISKVL